MDVYESKLAFQKQNSTVEKNNGNTRRPRTREVSSRYRSPTPSAASSGVRRCSSPNVTRIGTTTSTMSLPKRAISAERKRPTTPSSPTRTTSRPSTPVQDTSVEELLSRKLGGNRLPESLWPSTMRSLSVSFQSDTFSLPVSKREKPVSHALCDRTLRPSSNVVQKQGETPPASRKATPERRRSPLKGKNSADQAENSRPVDSLNARLVDQHRWPSRMGGKVSSGTMNRSVDLSDKSSKIAPIRRSVTPSLRRLSLDGYTTPLQKSSSDLLSLVSSDDRVKGRVLSVDDSSLSMQKSTSSSSLERTVQGNPVARSQTVSAPGSRLPSPNKASVISSSASRGVSPSRTRSVPSTPSRGPSPSRIRPSSPSRQPKTSTSVLSFIADIKKGKKAANHIEDVHQLRLLYNRHLQWRYANARSDAALHAQKLQAEKTLYNVWRNTSDLWASVIKKRTALQQLKLKLKLFAVLNEQLTYLDEWASIERDHTSSVSHAIQDLQACTLRLPIIGRAKGDIESVKEAVCSAVDVMQAMGSSMRFILSRVEGMNCLVSELADVAAQERAMLDECEALLSSTAAMQVEEYSIRSHLIQLKQVWRSDEQLILGN
uniref:AUGMIN subunit 8 n=1 Tax=Nicotiana tabacum TaxID=4097 RepID=A0A1S3X9V7_TOBAC|nr:PREDICTED: AUGMIN subunit 8-like [Nicotiana tabacum]XP_016436591.1 PREDICTED: AUGMIN subunit 8-like [Nicotiana tabacum]XP_016436592.1 PREDICTED: AUGMIN subunit 8-like [Nicotiana tabacum]XP_016436593.1 PREDICTED: AUGMIN subunit 8-like [Nicotiana tabacum]XP_016436594.1 PREDICTED: AUGMIN subunit 8-like [Nicotiana tabacum]